MPGHDRVIRLGFRDSVTQPTRRFCVPPELKARQIIRCRDDGSIRQLAGTGATSLSASPLAETTEPASDCNMSEDRVIRSGPFKGKKIQMASTAGVDQVRDVADNFMREIFEMEPEDYAISDESELGDFVGVGEETIGAIQARVNRVYGLDVSGIPHGNLLAIFVRIRGFQ